MTIIAEMFLDSHPGNHVLLPDGMYRLANPSAVVPGRVHVFRFDLFGTDATVVAVGILPTLGCSSAPQHRRQTR